MNSEQDAEMTQCSFKLQETTRPICNVGDINRFVMYLEEVNSGWVLTQETKLNWEVKI